MHWKTVNYLTTTYKYIFLEDFKVQSCIKGNIPSKIKRILNQYSFHQFKTRLQYGSEMRGCKLINVHSALTSKVCCNCGNKLCDITEKIRNLNESLSIFSEKFCSNKYK